MKVDVCMKCRKFKCYDPVTNSQWCRHCDYKWKVPGETTVWAKISFCIAILFAMIVGFVFWTVLP